MLLLALSYALFFRIGPHSSFLTVALPVMVVNGIGTAATFPALNMSAVTGVPDRDQGLAGALLNTFMQIGGAVVLALVTAVVEAGQQTNRGDPWRATTSVPASSSPPCSSAWAPRSSSGTGPTAGTTDDGPSFGHEAVRDRPRTPDPTPPGNTRMISTTPSTGAAEFAGKAALVTGAARGIGKETASLLHTRGAHVVALETRPELAVLSEELPGVVTVTGDVTAEETATRAVVAAVDAFGGLDILVNNAGHSLNKPVTHTTARDWDSVMDVNARGAFLFAREAFRAMEEPGGGAIVSTGSYASTVGLPEGVAYSASKGALAHDQGAGTGGRPPGHPREPRRRRRCRDRLPRHLPPRQPRLSRVLRGRPPPGQVAQPREIAEVLCFLVSPRSAFVMGAVLAADGGFTAA